MRQKVHPKEEQKVDRQEPVQVQHSVVVRRTIDAHNGYQVHQVQQGPTIHPDAAGDLKKMTLLIFNPNSIFSATVMCLKSE